MAASPEEPIPKRAKKEITYATHMARYEENIRMLEEAIDKRKKKGEKGTRIFVSVSKNLREMMHEVPKVAKSMKKRKPSNKQKVSGFGVKCTITDELAAFLQVKPGTTLTRTEITNGIYAYVKIAPEEEREGVLKWLYLNPDRSRNLQNQTNKTYILPDENLSKLLRYEEYKKDVRLGKILTKKTNKETKEVEDVVQTDDGLKYNIVQKLIQQHISEYKETKEPDKKIATKRVTKKT